jgi:glycine oxidase
MQVKTFQSIINSNFTPKYFHSMIHTRYIVVGQGLAGTVLAHLFLKNNIAVTVIDDPSLSKASKVAAGLYNPVVFKRLTSSWKADELLEVMDKYYPEAEMLLGEKIYFKKNIIKLFTEEQEKILWAKKCNEPVGKYLNKHIHDGFLNDVIYCNNGAAEVEQSGNVNIALFLKLFREYIKQNNCLIEESFDYSQLTVYDTHVVYKNIQADKIIFCEGYKALDNPFFYNLPLKLTKGEVLTISCPQLNQPYKVINKGVFILPIGNDLYRVGATYEWDDLSENTTQNGKEELLNKLKKILKVDFELIAHEAGIRPTVEHRRPLLGLHPQHLSLAIFNGLGTKGVMLAPYFANQLYNHLVNDLPIDKDVDVRNFMKEVQ